MASKILNLRQPVFNISNHTTTHEDPLSAFHSILSHACSDSAQQHSLIVVTSLISVTIQALTEFKLWSQSQTLNMATENTYTSTALVLALFVAFLHPSTCYDQTLQASVSCLDCGHHFDYSGIEVAVKCDKAEKLSVVSTESDGSFSVELPSPAPQTCLAKIVGGPSQLYISKSKKVSQVITNESKSYTLSAPLVFYTRPPKTFGSSKTVDIPLPPEWGLAPSSYYFPFFPIIGIP